MRVAFVGERTAFGACVPSGAPFVDHRRGADPDALARRLAELAPQAVVVFRPEIVPAGLLDDADALTLGLVVDPLPRELPEADLGQFDRLAAAGPAPSVPRLSLWRTLALPVDDSFFAPVGEWGRPPRVLFLGASTEHRERFLIDAKHEFDLLHIAFGLRDDALRERLARTDVGLNVHADGGPSFEQRVALHLAAGHLLVSEPLSPRHGLRPGVDLIETRTPDDLRRVIRDVRATPDRFSALRRQGRRGAERFRASVVWPRLLDDVARDVRLFGGRAAQSSSATRGASRSKTRNPT